MYRHVGVSVVSRQQLDGSTFVAIFAGERDKEVKWKRKKEVGGASLSLSLSLIENELR